MPALSPQLPQPRHDEIYQALVDLHDGLSEADSLKVWSRLALILIDRLGDPDQALAAIAAARPR